MDEETKEWLQEVVDKATTEHRCAPVFYVLTGSHIYGTSDETSDYDVRGFHITDGRQYMTLDPPEEQFIINQDGVTEGYEEYEEVDLVSYELRKFGKLLYKANFNVLEALYCGEEVMCTRPEAIENLRYMVNHHLPMDASYHYYGMAEHNYHRYLKTPESEGYKPVAKKFLYVLRGFYAAEYVQEHETIEADVMELAEEVGDEQLVKDLIQHKRENPGEIVPPSLHQRLDGEIADRLDSERPDFGYKEQYRRDINSWMLRQRE